jgi:hypothetical protein
MEIWNDKEALIKMEIDIDFILRDDLREWIFKEDENGKRYRERIWDKITEFGVENWFKAKGYPTNLDSVWKNRYCGGTETAQEEMMGGCYKAEEVSIEKRGYILWENYLPIDMWNDKELREDYKVGTKEYYDRIAEEEARVKKYDKKEKKKNEEIVKNEQDLTDIEKSNEQDLTDEKSNLSIGFDERGLYQNSSLTKPRNQLGSWSSGGGEVGKTNEEIMEKLLDFYRNNLKKPLSKEETPFTTTLDIKNCEVRISDEARAFLVLKGFDFKKFEEEEMKLKNSQVLATNEDLMKAKTFELMEKSMTKLRDECSAIRGYFECFLNRHKTNEKNPYFLKKINELGIVTTDLNKLKELYDSKANIYQIYYKKVYQMRWNTKCNDEYSYV